MNFVIVVPEHVDLMPSEDGQLTETCKGNKYLLIESHWTLLSLFYYLVYYTLFKVKDCSRAETE
jgi:hypothetical protein